MGRVRLVGRRKAGGAGGISVGAALARIRDMSQPHDNLIAWQRADDLCVAIYELTKHFPANEQYGLTSQLRRAAFSVPANIVEGYAFPRSPTRLRHLRIAIASLAEVGYALHFARRVGYLRPEAWQAIDLEVRKAAAPLLGLAREQASRPAKRE